MKGERATVGNRLHPARGYRRVKVMADLERNLSLASINKIKGGWPVPTERTFVARFRGKAIQAKAGTTQFGEYYKFIGTFIAWNKEGDEFIGNSLIVPEPAQSLIQASLATRGEDMAAVEFAFDLFIVPDEDPRNARKYKFVTATIFEDVGEAYSQMRKGMPALPMNKRIEGGKK